MYCLFAIELFIRKKNNHFFLISYSLKIYEQDTFSLPWEEAKRIASALPLLWIVANGVRNGYRLTGFDFCILSVSVSVERTMAERDFFKRSLTAAWPPAARMISRRERDENLKSAVEFTELCWKVADDDASFTTFASVVALTRHSSTSSSCFNGQPSSSDDDEEGDISLWVWATLWGSGLLVLYGEFSESDSSERFNWFSKSFTLPDKALISSNLMKSVEAFLWDSILTRLYSSWG